MKVTAITIHYSEARSARYQKVEHSVSLTDGETVRDAINKYRPVMVETVTQATFDDCVRVVEETDLMLEDGGAGGRRRR